MANIMSHIGLVYQLTVITLSILLVQQTANANANRNDASENKTATVQLAEAWLAKLLPTSTTTTTPTTKKPVDGGIRPPSRRRERQIIKCCRKAGVKKASTVCGYKHALATITATARVNDRVQSSNSTSTVFDAYMRLYELFHNGSSAEDAKRERLEKAKQAPGNNPFFTKIVQRAAQNVTKTPRPLSPAVLAYNECPIRPPKRLMACCRKAKVSKAKQSYFSQCLALCTTDFLKRVAQHSDPMAIWEFKATNHACGFKTMKAALDCKYSFNS